MRQISSLPKHVDHKTRGDAEVKNVNWKHLLQKARRTLEITHDSPLSYCIVLGPVLLSSAQVRNHQANLLAPIKSTTWLDKTATNGRPLGLTSSRSDSSTLGTALQLCTKPPAHTWNKFVPSGLTVSALSEVINLQHISIQQLHPRIWWRTITQDPIWTWTHHPEKYRRWTHILSFCTVGLSWSSTLNHRLFGIPTNMLAATSLHLRWPRSCLFSPSSELWPLKHQDLDMANTKHQSNLGTTQHGARKKRVFKTYQKMKALEASSITDHDSLQKPVWYLLGVFPFLKSNHYRLLIFDSPFNR